MSRILTKILDKSEYTYIDLHNSHIYNFAQSNPSIVFFNDKLFVNFRCVNYLTYVSCNNKYKKEINGWISNNKVYSKNYMGYIENDKIQNVYKNVILNNIDYNSKYAGLEDAILVVWNNTLYMCGTRCDIDINKGRFCIYKLNENFDIEEETIIKDDSFVNAIEKHWSPIENEPFTFIRWCNPTEIVKIEPLTGNVVNREIKKSNITGNTFRGNCQTIKTEDGYLSIVHDTKRYYNNNSELLPSYKHYFIQYDNNFEIVKMSRPFNFEQDDIEFCCGLQLKDDKIYISYSIYDSIPSVIVFDKQHLNKVFSNINSKDNKISLYEKGNSLLKDRNFYGAAACYSRIFSFTENKNIEYYSLMKFCVCVLAIKSKGVNIFSDDIIASFIDTLLLLNDETIEPYYLYAVYYEMKKEFEKSKFYKNQCKKYRFEFPEIKQYLRMV